MEVRSENEWLRSQDNIIFTPGTEKMATKTEVRSGYEWLRSQNNIRLTPGTEKAATKNGG